MAASTSTASATSRNAPNAKKKKRRSSTNLKNPRRKTQAPLSKRQRLGGRAYRGCDVKPTAKTSRIALILAAVCALSGSAYAQTQPPTTYALTHAKIFTLAESTIEDGTLIIRDGKIAAVGVGVDIPAGAQVIDAKGLQVYAGLFDSITQMRFRKIGAVSATVDSAAR